MLSRRDLLSGSLSVCVSRSAVAIPVAAELWCTSAKSEPITIAIAIASAVAGMIASHGGGSGIGDFLQAIDKKLDVAIDQLASLQSAISVCLR